MTASFYFTTSACVPDLWQNTHFSDSETISQRNYKMFSIRKIYVYDQFQIYWLFFLCVNKHGYTNSNDKSPCGQPSSEARCTEQYSPLLSKRHRQMFATLASLKKSEGRWEEGCSINVCWAASVEVKVCVFTSSLCRETLALSYHEISIPCWSTSCKAFILQGNAAIPVPPIKKSVATSKVSGAVYEVSGTALFSMHGQERGRGINLNVHFLLKKTASS